MVDKRVLAVDLGQSGSRFKQGELIITSDRGKVAGENPLPALHAVFEATQKFSADVVALSCTGFYGVVSEPEEYLQLCKEFFGAKEVAVIDDDLAGFVGALGGRNGVVLSVGGVAADYTDSQDGIAHTLPWALGWIAVSVLILIFIFTGSIILPIKAVILNFLSLGATMSVLTWVFIDGHLQWLVGSFTVTGTLDTSIGILISVVVFGLSMDYELFLLSRIREEHLAGKTNVEAVATGLQRSARIITAAALLLAVVFAAFVTSGVTSIKSMGFGVALAVILDATIVRALLVPALMRLFGERNWWAPKWMQRFTIDH